MGESYTEGFRPVRKPEACYTWNPADPSNRKRNGTKWELQYANFRVVLFAPVGTTEVEEVRERWMPHKPRKPAAHFGQALEDVKMKLLCGY